MATARRSMMKRLMALDRKMKEPELASMNVGWVLEKEAAILMLTKVNQAMARMHTMSWGQVEAWVVDALFGSS